MKVNRPESTGPIMLMDLEIGTVFTFALHLDYKEDPGIYVRTDKGYFILRGVSDLNSGRTINGCNLECTVRRVTIDEVTILP